MAEHPSNNPLESMLPRAWRNGSLRGLGDIVLLHSAVELRQALSELACHPALYQSPPGKELRRRLQAVERELTRRSSISPTPRMC